MTHESALRRMGPTAGWSIRVVTPSDAPRSYADLDDAALIAASVAGERDAFDVIVERHRRCLNRVSAKTPIKEPIESTDHFARAAAASRSAIS